MNSVVSSAPGKLFITGEYAVLDCAPAFVTAVDVRAVCKLRRVPDSDGRVWRVVTPPLSATPGVFRVVDGLPEWDGEPIRLVDAAWRALSEEQRATLARSAWHVSLDTSAFFLKDRKLGLGSSAAALGALMGALWTVAGGLPEEPAAFATLKTAHHMFQGGGSGADLAATLAGGTILYRREPRIAASVAVPDGFDILPVWSGKSAATGEFLRKLAEFQQTSPDVFRERFAVLEKEAEEAGLAASAGDTEGFIEAFDDSGAALRALGEAANLPIWSAEHENINAIVRQAGGVYKPSGAGGGDIGLAIFRTGDAQALEALKSALSSAGYNILPLRFGARGLHITDVSEQAKR